MSEEKTDWESLKGTTLFYKELDGTRTLYIRLFLYVKEDGLEDIIKNQRIRISCPARTNDITEGVAQSEFIQREDIRQYGYICLSAAHNSPCMWGYYADRSRGACIVFDFPIHKHNDYQFRILKNGIDKPGLGATWLERIKYCRYRAKGDALIFGFKEQNFELLTRKSIDWKHEKEYRVFYNLNKIDADNIDIINENNMNHVIYYDNNIVENISGIILGVNYPGAVSDVESKIKVAKTHYVSNKADNNAYHLNNIKIIKALFSKKEFNFNIPVDHHNIPLIEDQFINQEWQKLFEVDWYAYNTNLIDPTAIAKHHLNQDGYACVIDIIGKRRNLAIFDSYGNDEKYYALFEYASEASPLFYEVHTIRQDKLKELYEHAKASSEKIRRSTGNVLESYIMPPNFDI